MMTKTPIHLWIVGILALLWNAGGAFDYVMTQTGNQDYLAMLTEPQRAYLDAVPPWFEAFWALGVWFAVLGSLLLLLRSRWAGSAFAVSLVGLIGASVYSFGLASPSATAVMGTFSLIFSAAIGLSLILLLIYARWMRQKGVLN